MTKLSPKAEMLAQSFSDMFWDLVAWDSFCDGCNAPGVHDPEQGCRAGDDPFSPECYRHADAEDIEERISKLAVSLVKALEY